MRAIHKVLAAGILLLLAACQASPAAPTLTPSPALPPTPDEPRLPRAVQGYELYSWPRGEAWFFTLITGTERSKAIEEITALENTVTEAGWVKITAQGAEDFIAVLGRLPVGESVAWMDGSGVDMGAEQDIRLALPQPEAVAAVQARCQALGLVLALPGEAPATLAQTPTAGLAANPVQAPQETYMAPPDLSPLSEVAAPTSRDMPLALPAGLTVEEYRLRARPQADPLVITPVQGTVQSLLERRADFRQQRFPDRTFFAQEGFAMRIDLVEQPLVAVESYPPEAAGWVSVRLGDIEIYKIEVGKMGPVPALQGLWVYDDHWVMESVHAAERLEDGVIYFDRTGQITQEGALLNTLYGYEEMFGFQTLAGRPFYFFTRDGKTGLSYDGQVVEAGYDEVLHYQCCSSAVLDIGKYENMVVFFAQREGSWYYVEVGVYGAP